MLRRFQLCLVFAAGIAATGSQWDLVQTYAWSRMIYRAAQTMPVTAAVRATFQPASMCNLCRLVNDAKQKEQTNSVPEAKLEGKILLFFQAATRTVVAVQPALKWSSCDQDASTVARGAPALRPPRDLAA